MFKSVPQVAEFTSLNLKIKLFLVQVAGPLTSRVSG